MTEIIPLQQLPHDVRRLISSGHIDVRTVCPKCGGGRSKERSLSIRPVDDESELVLKLSCWRATCGWWAMTAHHIDSRHTTPSSLGRPYVDPIEPLSPDMIDMLISDYGLSMYDVAKHGWGRGSNGELVMPVRDAYGAVLGHTTRTFGRSKFCATYKTTMERPFLDWWLHEAGRPLVVVEDQLSACRAYSAGLDAVALLGTNINVEDAKQIARRSKKPFLALDRDAFLKALKLRARHFHILEFLPICLDNDIKNMQTDTEIRALFGVDYDRRGITGSSNLPAESSL